MKTNAIMLAFGKKPKVEREDGDEPEDMDEDEPESKDDGEDKPSPEEVKAFRELKDAFEGGDDETGAQALKNFIRECKGY